MNRALTKSTNVCTVRVESMNRLYFGDNLAWLRNTEEFPDASVDLVHLDPPMDSNADVMFLRQSRT